MTGDDDERLVARLRELSMVDVGAVLSGGDAEGREAIRDALAEDLEQALAEARRRAGELAREIEGSADPLAALDASPDARARSGGEDALAAARRAADRRDDACRRLARLDAVAALVLPRLIEVDRLRS